MGPEHLTGSPAGHKNNLSSRPDRLRRLGMLTTRELANQLLVSESAIQKWGRQRLLTKRYHDGLRDLWEPPVGHTIKVTVGDADSAYLLPLSTSR